MRASSTRLDRRDPIRHTSERIGLIQRSWSSRNHPALGDQQKHIPILSEICSTGRKLTYTVNASRFANLDKELLNYILISSLTQL